MKFICHGTIEKDSIKLNEKINVPLGTKAIVTLQTVSEHNQQEIKKRQLEILEKGFYLGERLYSNREDLYE